LRTTGTSQRCSRDFPRRTAAFLRNYAFVVPLSPSYVS
jgi:hypothetical protein